MKRLSVALAVAVAALATHIGQAAGPAFRDDFDGYSAGTTFVSPTNGWQASGNAVMVTNNVARSAPNSVVVARQTALTNTVNGGSDKVIWTDCYLKPALGDLPSGLPVDTASFVAYFNPSGYVEVATSSGWITCSNDVWGGAIPAAGSGFARVSVYQNYSASNAAVFVDGRLAIQDMRFAGSSAAYNTFSVSSPSSNAWLDNVWIKTNYDAATLTNDVNADGVADAAELAQYGYAARTLYVVGPGVPSYGNIGAALGAWRARDSVYVPSGNYSEDVVVSNAVTFVGGIFTNSGTLRLQAGITSAFSNAMSWGTVEVGSNAAAVLGQALTCTTLVVRAGSTVTVVSLMCSNLVVESGAHFACLGAFQCDSTSSIGTDAVATFSGSVTCAGAFTVAGGATVSLGQGATLGSLDATGAVVVGAGKTLTVGSATVSGGVQVSGSGAVVVNGTLNVSGSGLLTFTNSLLNVTSGNMVLNGTFTVNNTWGQAAAVVPLRFADDFERYTDGARIADLGFTGWGASETSVVVQAAVANPAVGGSKAIVLPTSTTVSNRTSTSFKKIWTDCYLMPTLGKPPFNPPTNTAGFVAFADTNGWLEIATSNGWVVCSNLVSGAGEPDRMTTSTWTRVTVCQNLTNDTIAVFVNGKLVRQLLKAPGSAPATYTSFSVDNPDGQAYLDDVVIDGVWPVSVSADLDHDLVADAEEVDRLGSMTARNDWVGGSVYLIR